MEEVTCLGPVALLQVQLPEPSLLPGEKDRGGFALELSSLGPGGGGGGEEYLEVGAPLSWKHFAAQLRQVNSEPPCSCLRLTPTVSRYGRPHGGGPSRLEKRAGAHQWEYLIPACGSSIWSLFKGASLPPVAP